MNKKIGLSAVLALFVISGGSKLAGQRQDPNQKDDAFRFKSGVDLVNVLGVAALHHLLRGALHLANRPALGDGFFGDLAGHANVGDKTSNEFVHLPLTPPHTGCEHNERKVSQKTSATR